MEKVCFAKSVVRVLGLAWSLDRNLTSESHHKFVTFRSHFRSGAIVFELRLKYKVVQSTFLVFRLILIRVNLLRRKEFWHSSEFRSQIIAIGFHVLHTMRIILY